METSKPWKRLSILLALAALTAAASEWSPAKGKPGGPAAAPPQQPAPAPTPQAPQAAARPGGASAAPVIEAVFVLDTTGSMGGLIQGAKDKIWAIASQLSDGEPQPQLRVGLIAYRDHGDTYVTKKTVLTPDLDLVYDALQALVADGGGDTPEAVNQALYEAVTDMAWSKDPSVYRVIFLVGDAPPQTYPNELDFSEIAKLAHSRDIRINAVQCGDLAGTRQVWQQIATLARGAYAAIAQDGAVVVTTAPQDEELGQLQRTLAATAVLFGTEAEQATTRRKIANALSAPVGQLVSRGSYLSKNRGTLTTGKSDLVDAVRNGETTVAEVPDNQLPDDLRAMPLEARRHAVDERIRQRKAIQARIDELSKARDAYVRAETSRLAKEGKVNGFDQKVLSALKEQAATKGIVYR